MSIVIAIAVAAVIGIAIAAPAVASGMPVLAGWIGAACFAAGVVFAGTRWSRLPADAVPTVRERSAWATLAVSALISSYFVASRVWGSSAAPAMFANIAMLQMVWVGASVWLSVRDRGGFDERDREIERRAYRYAYYAVLAYIGGLIGFSFRSHAAADAVESLNSVRYALIGALLVGQFVESAGRLCLYRKAVI